MDVCATSKIPHPVAPLKGVTGIHPRCTEWGVFRLT